MNSPIITTVPDDFFNLLSEEPKNRKEKSVNKQIIKSNIFLYHNHKIAFILKDMKVNKDNYKDYFLSIINNYYPIHNDNEVFMRSQSIANYREYDLYFLDPCNDNLAIKFYINKIIVKTKLLTNIGIFSIYKKIKIINPKKQLVDNFKTTVSNARIDIEKTSEYIYENIEFLEKYLNFRKTFMNYIIKNDPIWTKDNYINSDIDIHFNVNQLSTIKHFQELFKLPYPYSRMEQKQLDLILNKLDLQKYTFKTSRFKSDIDIFTVIFAKYVNQIINNESFTYISNMLSIKISKPVKLTGELIEQYIPSKINMSIKNNIIIPISEKIVIVNIDLKDKFRLSNGSKIFGTVNNDSSLNIFIPKRKYKHVINFNPEMNYYYNNEINNCDKIIPELNKNNIIEFPLSNKNNNFILYDSMNIIDNQYYYSKIKRYNDKVKYITFITTKELQNNTILVSSKKITDDIKNNYDINLLKYSNIANILLFENEMKKLNDTILNYEFDIWIFIKSLVNINGSGYYNKKFLSINKLKKIKVMIENYNYNQQNLEQVTYFRDKLLSLMESYNITVSDRLFVGKLSTTEVKENELKRKIAYKLYSLITNPKFDSTQKSKCGLRNNLSYNFINSKVSFFANNKYKLDKVDNVLNNIILESL